MNISKIARSEICQMCAKCCKTFSELVDFDTAKRMIMLETDKISVKEIKVGEGNSFYRVTYDFPCEKLKQDKGGKYYCEIYGDEKLPRPFMCQVYPDNIPMALLEFEKGECPALKEIRSNTQA